MTGHHPIKSGKQKLLVKKKLLDNLDQVVHTCNPSIQNSI